MTEGQKLTTEIFAKALRILEENERLIGESVKTTRTSLHPENRHKIDFEVAWMESELLSGKFLILPPSIYEQGIAQLRNLGVFEEALENIHTSVTLKAQ